MTARTETTAVGVTDNGTVAFYNPATQTSIRRLGPAADDLQDLRGYTRILTLTGFAQEVFGVGTKTTEEV